MLPSGENAIFFAAPLMVELKYKFLSLLGHMLNVVEVNKSPPWLWLLKAAMRWSLAEKVNPNSRPVILGGNNNSSSYR